MALHEAVDGFLGDLDGSQVFGRGSGLVDGAVNTAHVVLETENPLGLFDAEALDLLVAGEDIEPVLSVGDQDHGKDHVDEVGEILLGHLDLDRGKLVGILVEAKQTEVVARVAEGQDPPFVSPENGEAAVLNILDVVRDDFCRSAHTPTQDKNPRSRENIIPSRHLSFLSVVGTPCLCFLGHQPPRH